MRDSAYASRKMVKPNYSSDITEDCESSLLSIPIKNHVKHSRQLVARFLPPKLHLQDVAGKISMST